MTSETSCEYSRRYRELHPEKCREWGRDWFRRNSARIAAERAKKMQDDPEHAETVREYYRKYWRKRASGEHIPSSLPLYHKFDGKIEQVFRTSEAARLLFCSTGAICQWHKKGWLSPPLVIHGRRLYRRVQVDLMGLILCVRRRSTRIKVLKFISENW